MSTRIANEILRKTKVIQQLINVIKEREWLARAGICSGHRQIVDWNTFRIGYLSYWLQNGGIERSSNKWLPIFNGLGLYIT
jgi:hypothetical protein